MIPFVAIRIFSLLALFFYTQWKLSQVFLFNFATTFFITFVFYVFMIAWIFIYRMGSVSADSIWTKIMVWSGSLAMAFWATFTLFYFATDMLTVIADIFSKTHFDQKRKLFLFQNISFGVMGASFFMVAAGVRQALRGPQIKKVKIISNKITKNLNGLKIAQISDLHVGLTIDKRYIENVVQKTLEKKPNIIVITGDIADGTPETLKDRLEPLKKLNAPLGVFYAVGNHEYYWGVEKWVEQAKDLGFTPLLNENRVLKINGDKLMIAGVTDSIAHQFIKGHTSDAQKAALTSENPHFKILLAHRPQAYEDAEIAGFDLQLSGHTHAGQFFPFNLLIPLFHRYYKGLNKHNDLQIYVNQGTGYWGPADRFAVPSEITLLELSS